MGRIPFQGCLIGRTNRKWRLQEKMLIRHGIDNRMVKAMELAAVFPIAGSVVRAANYKSAPALFLPSSKQPPQFAVHIAEGCRMAWRLLLSRNNWDSGWRLYSGRGIFSALGLPWKFSAAGNPPGFSCCPSPGKKKTGSSNSSGNSWEIPCQGRSACQKRTRLPRTRYHSHPWKP